MRCTGDDRDFTSKIDFGDMVGCWVILGRQTNLEGRSRGGTGEVVSQQCWSNKSSTGKSGQETTLTFRMCTLLHFFPPYSLSSACTFDSFDEFATRIFPQEPPPIHPLKSF